MNMLATTLPLPHVLTMGLGFRSTVIRAVLHRAESPHVYEERGEELLGVRNAAATVKAAVGWAEVSGVRHLLAATAGDIVDYAAAFTRLHPHVATHLLPVYPGDVARTREGVSALLDELPAGGGCGRVAERQETAMHGRLLAEMLGRQRQRVFPSGAWHNFLLDLLQPAAVPLPEADGSHDDRVPVAVMGCLAGFSDLYDLVEMQGGRVVYDEWAELAAELALAREPYAAMARSALVTGPVARLARLKPHLDDISAVILVVEPFSASALDEAWFRNDLGKPLLVLESERLGLMDSARQLRLENFSTTVF